MAELLVNVDKLMPHQMHLPVKFVHFSNPNVLHALIKHVPGLEVPLPPFPLLWCCGTMI